MYIRDLTGGSLLISESRLVAEALLLELPAAEWNHLFIEENILRKKSRHTSIRYASSVRRRLEPLGKAFIDAIIHAPEPYYKQLLMLALMIHTPVLPDFMRHVVAETKRIYRTNLASDAWESFLLDRIRTLPALVNMYLT